MEDSAFKWEQTPHFAFAQPGKEYNLFDRNILKYLASRVHIARKWTVNWQFPVKKH